MAEPSYTAERLPFMSNYEHSWFVRHPGGIGISDLTEAEAHIIAWALRAVAQGLVLQAFHEFDDLEFAMAYDGPTDGVAPQGKDKPR